MPYYSPSTKGFYSSEQNRPPDSVFVTHSDVEDYMYAQSVGKVCSFNLHTNKFTIQDIVLPLCNIKELKYNEIRGSYEELLNRPVACAYGSFNGGEVSAAAIREAVTLSDFNGEATVIITNINNYEVICSKAQALEIAAAIGNVHRQLFIKKQRLMRAVADATTSEEVNSITWE